MPKVQKITQAQLKRFLRLGLKKYRQLERRFLAEGIRLVEDSLDSDWEVEALVVSSAFLEKGECRKILGKAASRGIGVVEASTAEMQKLADTVTSQGIIAVVKARLSDSSERMNSLPRNGIVVALEGISDPGNLGTILRTCDWFGASLVLLDHQCVELYNPKVVRATMGAIFHLPICEEIDLPGVLHAARKRGFKVLVTALEGGSPIGRLSDSPGTVIVFGSEARGVSSALKLLASEVITIPKYGRAESLNVGIACGVVLGTLAGRQ